MNNLKEHLKNTTWPIHEWLETSSSLQCFHSDNITLEQYQKLILKMNLFFNILEPKIASYKEKFISNGLIDIEHRLQRVNWLDEDLNKFDDNVDFDVVNKAEFKTLDSFDSIVGALYVCEGSTMGGMQIIKILQSKMNEDLPFRLYRGYEDKTMPMWQNFSMWLDNANINPHKALLGATETYIVLRELLDD